MQMPPSIFAQASFWLEPAASTSAERHDPVFYTVLWVTVFFFALVVALMLLFVVLYRRRKGEPQREGPTHNTPLEVIWTGVPLATVIGLFVIGLHAFVDFDTPPADATVVDVEARQWAFTFTYPNGALGDKLYLEQDRPVILQLHSKDVLHALYIPAFRVQRNAVPGRTTEMWLRPVRLGSYHIFCTQYCGDGHSRMTTEAVVLGTTSYAAKLAQLANIFVNPATHEPLPLAQVGKSLYESNGCGQCHSIDGSPGIGPTWLGLYKSDVAFSVAPPGYTLAAGDSDAKWDAYVRQHVLNPGATIVKGYQNVMQSYADRFSGSPYKDKKLAAVVAFIKSLGKGKEEPGEKKKP